MKIQRIKKENIYAILAVVLTFLFYVIHTCRAVDINISLDELGTFAGAATLGGYDWKEALTYTRYYGYGFYWIYALIFRLTNNPYIIYGTMCIGNYLIISVVAFLIYKIEVKELCLPNGIMTMLFAIFPGVVYSIVNYSYLTNDIMVYVCYWLITYMVLKLMANPTEKRRKIYSIMLAFFMCYALTIHEKCIGIFWIVLIGIIVWEIIGKRKIVNKKYFFLSLILFYSIARITKELIIYFFWNEVKADTLANTSVLYTDVTWFGNSLAKFKVVIDIFISNIVKLGTQTYGLFYIGCAVVLIKLCSFLNKKIRKKPIDLSDIENKTYWMIGISLFIILITMAGLALTWSSGVWNKLALDIELGKSARAYTYLRYYIIYVGPLLIAIYKMCRDALIERREIEVAFVIFGFTIYYYLMEIRNYLPEETKVLELFDFSIGKNNNIHLSILILIVMMVAVYCFEKLYARIIWGVLCTGLLIYLFVPKTMGEIQISSSLADATYSYVKELEENATIDGNKLYVLDSLANYQFFLNKYSLKMYENENEGIVFSHYTIDELEEQMPYIDLGKLREAEFQCIDEDEFVYILRK